MRGGINNNNFYVFEQTTDHVTSHFIHSKFKHYLYDAIQGEICTIIQHVKCLNLTLIMSFFITRKKKCTINDFIFDGNFIVLIL